MEQVSYIQVLGLIILIVGLAIRYFLNRRLFNRTNAAGVETFKNFEHKSVVRPLEWIFKWLAIALMLTGFLLIAVECYNRNVSDKHQQQKTLVP